MRNAAKLASLLALVLTIAPSLLYFAGVLGHDAVKVTALVGTVAWFIATPLWMGREPAVDSAEVEV